ncbi:MAG: hypothetical protein Tp1122DCM00d2C27307611_19 [Prokaryotic dsDNA virus sp.]|nr:MAG: hypothetical protein Tp1122DCM00d2C27307611_19 [Prokaryotic dsDNA virus sp.]|tara:strand:- start:3666 stop:4259 length:594 start_codon:yes stop_codon:yes gene_type:complete
MQKKTQNIIKKDINDLISAEYNPRQLKKDQYENIKESLLRFGFVDPVIINKNKDRKNIIIGGHQRIKVAKDLNYKEVPCIEIDLSLDKEKELNIRLNKNVGEWDYDILANLFDFNDLMDWGFTDEDLKLFDNDYDEEFSLPDGDKEPFRQITFTLSDEQYEVVEAALKKAKKNDFSETGNENSNGNAIWWICNSYEG